VLYRDVQPRLLQPTVQSRILGELPASVLSQLAPSALDTLPVGWQRRQKGPAARGERQKTAARR
jgi:hypothetical protein